jgi:hypothetical protein
MHIIRRRRNINSPATGGNHKAQQGRDESPDQYEMTLVPPAIELDEISDEIGVAPSNQSDRH